MNTESNFYCAICDGYFDKLKGESIAYSLDRHLASIHSIPVNIENGKATLAANGLRATAKDKFRMESQNKDPVNT